RESGMDDGTHLFGFQQRPDMFAQLAGDVTLEGDGPWAQRGAGDGEATTQYLTAIELALVSTQRGDDDDTAIVSQTVDVACDVVTRHHVENHIGTTAVGRLLYFFDEVLAAIVN